MDEAGGEEPLFEVRGPRMHPIALWGVAVVPTLFVMFQLYLNVFVRQRPGAAAVMALLVVALGVTVWLRFGRCSFALFADRIELRVTLDPFLPRGRTSIPLADLQRATLRGFNLRLYTDPGSCSRSLYTLPLARVVSEDFLDRLEMLAEERELGLVFEEDGPRRTVRRAQS